jgi:HlyD family secretion protein
MEPANKPPVKHAKEPAQSSTEVEFLPDADAIERSPLPRSLRITLHLMVGAMICFILWASLSQMEKIVQAHGRLVNPLPNIVVQPLENSIVQAIDVRVGQVVRKGQRLASLDPTFTQADETQLRQRLASLDTQVARTDSELRGTASDAAGSTGDSALQMALSAERRANFAAQKTRLDENIARLRASIDTNQRDQVVLKERVKALGEIEAMQQSLIDANFGARMQLLEARDRRLEVERQVTMANNRNVELSRELRAAQAEREAFDKGWRQKSMEDLLAATRERDSVREQLTKADKMRQLVVLTAPADAVVLEIAKVSPGSVARATEPVFTLVPLNAVLEAEVEINSLDIGNLKVGDSVHLKLDAFPFQKHGMLEGKLRTVSRDAFKRENVAAGQGTDAYYTARVGFAGSTLRNLPAGVQMLPGMTVTGEIVVGKRSVMSYLIWPLTKAMDESLREP